MFECGIIPPPAPEIMESPAVLLLLLPVAEARQEEALVVAVPVLAVAMEVPQAEVVPAVAMYLMRRLYLPAVPVPVLLARRAIKMYIES